MRRKRFGTVFLLLLFIIPSLIMSMAIFGQEPKNILDSLFDLSLRSACIDPDSEEAGKLAEDWLNSLSLQKQSDEDIKQITDSLIEPGKQQLVRKILANPESSQKQKLQQLRTLIGEVKWCSVCTQKWPFDYIYCPYHKTVLTWGRDTLTAKDGNEMVLIPAGEFLMGSNLGAKDEKPAHKIWLDAFYIGKYEVTVGQYKRFIQETGYPAPDWSKVGKHSPTDKHPIIWVSWHDATAYCNWAGCRLPTEAEWEKAARGKTGRQEYPTGDVLTPLHANYNNTYEGATAVGKFPAAGFGVCDMAGNTYEWCGDWYGADFYPISSYKNPEGPNSGTHRILRGGSWGNIPGYLRCADRNSLTPDSPYFLVGFRVAKDFTH